MVENLLGVTLRQTRPAAALLGDTTQYTGLNRSRIYRWFTDPTERANFPEEDHASHSRSLTALLAAAYARYGPSSPAAEPAARDEQRIRSHLANPPRHRPLLRAE